MTSYGKFEISKSYDIWLATWKDFAFENWKTEQKHQQHQGNELSAGTDSWVLKPYQTKSGFRSGWFPTFTLDICCKFMLGSRFPHLSRNLQVSSNQLQHSFIASRIITSTYYVRLPTHQFVHSLNSDGPDQGVGLEPNNSRSAAYLNIQNQTTGFFHMQIW